MLQVDRLRNVKSSVDFVARNKKAVGTNLKKTPASRSKVKQPVQQVKEKVKPAESANTVVVSKQYLDELLRNNSHHHDDDVMDNTSVHVDLHPSQVPGLENTPDHPSRHINEQESPLNTTNHHSVDAVKEQWLKDLAQQAREQKQRKENEKLKQKQITSEEYFPFGRPGGGAPIRSTSGQLLTNYRFRSQIGGVTSLVEKSHDTPRNTAPKVQPLSTNQIAPTNENDTTPRFARGAGPFVDQYILQEREEKRKKQMEHMAFIYEQVAAKERAKMEERLHQEREEAIEESRLAREREQMKVDFEREKHRATQKELESLKQQSLLHRRIAEAKESARQAKRTTRNTHGNIQNHRTDHMTDPHHLLPAKFNSTLRSPSLMQLSAESASDLTTKDMSMGATPHPPPGAPSKNTPLPPPGAPSKNTPLPPPGAPSKNTPHPPPGAPSKNTPHNKSRVRRVSRIPVLSTNGRNNKLCKAPSLSTARVPAPHNTQSTRLHDLLTSHSPPVPALAKRLAVNKSHDPINESHDLINESHDLPKSPPVPALAKRLAVNKSHDPINESHDPPKSPSVPALVKKLTVNKSHDLINKLHDPPKSPPVPALAKTLSQNDTLNDNDVISSDHAHSFPINRPPSCNLIAVPDSSPHPTTVTKETSDNLVPRQQLILEQLAELRKGILSQKCTMDDRVKRILSRKKCTF